jgi:hypothetical protein
MEIIRTHKTATLPAVFRLDEHARRAGVDAADVLAAFETAGSDEAWASISGRRITVHALPPESPGGAPFVVQGGRVFAVRGFDSVVRDTIVNLTHAGECDAAAPGDESFLADPVWGVRPLKDGPHTRRVQELFRRAVRGELPGYEQWLTYVGRILF